MQLRRAAFALQLLAALAGCKPHQLFPVRGGRVLMAMPRGEPSAARAARDPMDGELVQTEPGKWQTSLRWEPDPRLGPPADEQALAAAAAPHAELVRGAKALRDLSGDAAKQEGESLLAVDGHPAALIKSPAGDAVVWRCEQSGRLFTLSVQGAPGFSLEELAGTVQCHDAHTKPAMAEVPAANLVALGEGWALAKRTPSSAVYLRGDALLELFAGQRTEPSDDLVLAAHLAPAWIEAADLHDVHVETGEHANGPLGHPAVSLRGEATLDGHPIRWSFLEWRCLQHARTYRALVVSEPLPANAPPPSSEQLAAGGFTGHDAALLAVRCHG